MASFNKTILMGNLTKNPEIKQVGSTSICTLNLAMNRKYKTASGESREDVCFVEVTVWGKQGENCNTYLKKGSSVLVEGRLKFDSWDDRETGKKRSKLTIVADSVTFTSAKSDNDTPQQNGGYQSQQKSQPWQQQPPQQQQAPASSFVPAPGLVDSFDSNPNDEQIPF